MCPSVEAVRSVEAARGRFGSLLTRRVPLKQKQSRLKRKSPTEALKLHTHTRISLKVTWVQILQLYYIDTNSFRSCDNFLLQKGRNRERYINIVPSLVVTRHRIFWIR